jgi:hypothetical protein
MTMGARILPVAVALLLTTTAAASPQAVCSAPHSAPSVGQGGSVGTLSPGAGWVQLSVFGQNAAERFDFAGERQPFFAAGEARTRSVYLTTSVGVLEGLDVWAQAAVHDLRYQDDGGVRERTGLGDIRVAVRGGASLVGLAMPVAIRAGVKLPGNEFPVDATILPLSEGQTDVELSVETARTLAGDALFGLGWIGHRWRFGQTTADRRPGDEWFVHLGLGGRYQSFRWQLGADALRGGAPSQQGVTLTSDRRRLVQLNPSVAWAVGPGEVDIGGHVPISGRNLPSDPGFSIGYRFPW